MRTAVIKKTGLFLFLLCSMLDFAQGESGVRSSLSGRPNFTGTWVLDKTKTDMSGFNRDLRKSGITLVVEHREPEIKITRTFRRDGKDRKQELVFYTDGRGERNPVLDGRLKILSHTEWDGERLLTKSTFRSPPIQQGVIEYETLTRWELSADGATLTQTIIANAPRIYPSGQAVFTPAPPIDKRVFNRVP